MHWIVRPWRQMFDFSGRATRREFWLLYLQVTILYVLWLAIVGAVAGRGAPIFGSLAGLLFLPVMVICAIAVISAGVRRLHDHDKSGWLYLITLAPFFGWIFFLIMMLTPGTTGENSYGYDPRDQAAAAEDVAGVFS